MSFFPEGFDPRDDRVGMLDLCAIDTPDGPARFIIGTDARFTDTAGDVWHGSTLISVDQLQMTINDVAPRGALVLSYFQDPDAPSLASELRELGGDYLIGRAIRFYVQPIGSMAEFYAPTVAPLLWLTRTVTSVVFRKDGELSRQIGVEFAGWNEARRSARRIALNTEGHALLLGAPNPSLEFMPTSDFQPEKLFD